MALGALLAPLTEARRWQKVVLGVVFLAVLAGAGYHFVIAPLTSRVTALRSQRESQEQEITRTRALVADLARVRRQAAEVERQLEIAKNKLPTEREMPLLYRALSDAAVQSGLTVTLFHPQVARVRDFYSEIPIAVAAEGGYHEIGDFAARVAALARATRIGELKLTGVAAEVPRPAPRPPGQPAADAAKKPRPTLRAEITLLTYVYRPVGSPPAPKPAATTKPAEAPKP